MPFRPGDTFDRYTIEALIGEGGMGRVYRVYDGRLRRRVALKILRRDRLEDTSTAVPRLLREARAAAALDHPGSVAIFDVGEASGVPFIAMEHVAGRSLRSLVGDATVPIAERLRWLREIARVLAVAHAAGLVHRDVKPENVMVRDDGAIKVLDFGIAHRSPGDGGDGAEPPAPWAAGPDAMSLDESCVVGTPAYMAPEQVQRRPVDGRTDQFAWGVLAYELLHGALPWSEGEGVTILVAVVTEQPERLSPLLGVPEHVAAAVDRALEKDPDRRFATMNDLLAALEPTAGPRAARRPGHPTGASFASDGTLFVGREAELTTLRAWITGGKRLVTILGPPGVGKTRLARVAAGRDLAPMFAGRAWFVDLSEAEGLADVVHATARAFGASLSIEVGSQASIEPLAAMLAGLGRAVVVFDSMDRVAARHGAAMDRLLERAPGLCVVVTSRERLRLRAEHVLELGPLSFPAEGEACDAIERFEAVSLFVDRTHAVRPGYPIDAGELARVGAVVRLLDGLPLAIELAAARMTMLDAQGLLDRLGRRADVLRRDPREGASGQTSVEAAIEASWALLDPAERAALAQCSVFRGGFDLDAAEAVVDLAERPADHSGARPAIEALDVLERLRDRSLLAAREAGATGKLRFFLYLSIRDFAAGKLDEPARRGASRRHASWYATRARIWADAVGETGSATALAALALERDNLRAVPERLDPGAEDADLLACALLALDPLEHAEGSIEGHLRAIERSIGGAGASAELRVRLRVARGRALLALGRAPEAIAALEGARAASPVIEAEALLVEAGAHAALGATARARERATEARTSAAQAGQTLFAARADVALAALARDAGRLTEAADGYQRARIALRSVGARADEGRAALDLGLVRAALGSAEDAARLVTDAGGLLANAADPRLHAAARSAFGGIALDLGRGAEARAACEEALDQQRRLADRAGEAATLWRLGCVHLDEGDVERAETEALAALERASEARVRARVLGALAFVAWERGQSDAAGGHARQAIGYARQAIGCARSAGDRLAEGHLSALLGAIEASADRSTEAAQAFEEARRAHEGSSGTLDAESAALAEAFDDLRRARDLAARSNRKGAEEHRAGARARLARVLCPPSPGGAPLTQRSFMVRALARRLHRALAPQDRSRAWSEALDPERRALVLDVASRAFRLPGASAEAWIDVGGRRPLFRLLAALVGQRLREGGGPVSTGALVEAMWPGEEHGSEGADVRVEAEVAALRGMGLGELVEASSEGVGIHVEVAVLEVPGKI